jgi:hypothetical protein
MDTNRELMQVEEQLKECNQQIIELKRRSKFWKEIVEEFINEEEMCALETRRESLEVRQQELIELRSYQDSCEHLFVTDLIDVDPDRTLAIEYCKHCLFCK